MMKPEAMFARHDEFYICGWYEEDMKGHSSGVAGRFGARDERVKMKAPTLFCVAQQPKTGLGRLIFEVFKLLTVR